MKKMKDREVKGVTIYAPEFRPDGTPSPTFRECSKPLVDLFVRKWTEDGTFHRFECEAEAWAENEARDRGEYPEVIELKERRKADGKTND